MNRADLAPAAAARPAQKLSAYCALAALAVAYAALAALIAVPNSKLVLATAGGSPDWLLGPLRFAGLETFAKSDAGTIYFAGLLLAMALYAGVVLSARHFSTKLVVAAIVAFHMIFLLAPPILSQDVFSYIAYARLGTEHGLNPYAYAPLDIPLDPVFPFAGSKNAVTVYGPFFTLASYPLGAVSVPVAFWILKCLTAAASLGVVALVWRAANLLGRDPLVAASIVGLCPLTLVHVVGGAHNEALVMLFVMAGVVALLENRPARAGAFAMAGAGIKASAGIVFPFLILGARENGRRVVAGLAAAATAALVAAVAGFGPNAIDGLSLLSANQDRTSKYSLPHKLAEGIERVFPSTTITGLTDITRPLFAVVLLLVIAWLIRWVWHDRDRWLAATGWATLAVLLATAWLVPWYLLWLLPFVALVDDRRLLAATWIFGAYTLAIAIPF